MNRELITKSFFIKNKLEYLNEIYNLDIEKILVQLFLEKKQENSNNKIKEIQIVDLDDYAEISLSLAVYDSKYITEYDVYIDPRKKNLEVQELKTSYRDGYRIQNGQLQRRSRIFENKRQEIKIIKKYTNKENKSLKTGDKDNYIYEYIYDNQEFKGLIRITASYDFKEEEFINNLLQLKIHVNNLEALKEAIRKSLVFISDLKTCNYEVKEIRSLKEKVDGSKLDKKTISTLVKNDIPIEELLFNLLKNNYEKDLESINITSSKINKHNPLIIQLEALIWHAKDEVNALTSACKYYITIIPSQKKLKVSNDYLGYEDFYQIEDDEAILSARTFKRENNGIQITKKYTKKKKEFLKRNIGKMRYQTYEYIFKQNNFQAIIRFNLEEGKTFLEEEFIKSLLELEVIITNIEELKAIILVLSNYKKIPDNEGFFEIIELPKVKRKEK